MTKIDLAREVSQRTGISIAKTVLTLETMMDVIKKQMQQGNDIAINGFGVFCVKTRKPTRGRNLKTGEVIEVGERKAPSLKFSSVFKKSLNRN